MSARAAVIALAATALLLHASHFDHIADDAYISLRYLDHWLRGDGLVFNVGERVMGFSNLLWIVALAPFGAIGLQLPAAAQGLGAAASLGCLLLVCNELARQVPRRVMPAAAAGCWLAASGPFALWTQGGLEGPLFALTLSGATVAASRLAEAPSRRRLAAVCLCLGAAALTRPEGAAYGVVVAAWIAWRAEPSRRWHAALACLAASGAAWIALGVFSLSYYGDWLPNTYYAKTHPLSLAVLERGWVFSWAYLKGQYGASAFAVALFAATAGRSRRHPGWLAIAMIGAFSVYYLRIGGDALVYHRMWAYVQPLFALVFGAAIGWLLDSPRNAARRVACGRLALAASLLPLLALPPSFRGFELAYLRADDQRIRDLGELGRELERRAPTDTLVAANVIGALGYYSRLPLVDMLGLTDRHIARAAGPGSGSRGEREIGTPGHESHDARYVLDRAPDLILVGIPRASRRRIPLEEAFRPSFPSDRELAASPRLAADYDYRHFRLPGERYIALFVRRGQDGVETFE